MQAQRPPRPKGAWGLRCGHAPQQGVRGAALPEDIGASREQRPTGISVNRSALAAPC